MKDMDNEKMNEQFDPGTDKISQEDAISANLNTDENISGLQDVEMEEEEDKTAKELTEQKDKYLRLVAEFENFRKRTAKEKYELTLTANREVIQALLDVLDDAERAENQLEQSEDLVQIKEGVKLVFNKLRNTLQQKGLKKLSSKDEEFDAEKHEAITEVPGKSGYVIDEIQPGYALNDKLIRHAKVVVGK